MVERGGWFNESQRHALAAKGISTGKKSPLAEPKYHLKLPLTGMKDNIEYLLSHDFQAVNFISGHRVPWFRETKFLGGDATKQTILFENENGTFMATRQYKNIGSDGKSKLFMTEKTYSNLKGAVDEESHWLEDW
jgi:hypothetical protein